MLVVWNCFKVKASKIIIIAFLTSPKNWPFVINKFKCFSSTRWTTKPVLTWALAEVRSPVHKLFMVKAILNRENWIRGMWLNTPVLISSTPASGSIKETERQAPANGKGDDKPASKLKQVQHKKKDVFKWTATTTTWKVVR